jgi:hypothetical protein
MMHTVRIGALTIPDGADVSNWLTRREYEDAVSVSLAGMNGLALDTYVIDVSDNDDSPDDGNIAVLQTGTTPADIAVPAADKAILYPELPNFLAFRVRASGVVSGDQSWYVSKSCFV